MKILFHASCADGFCCAWLLHSVYPDAEFIAMQYGDEAPDVTGNNVIIADFCFRDLEVLKRMCDQAVYVWLFDHHETSAQALEGFEHANATIVFDMTKSGAELVWDWGSARYNEGRFWYNYPPWLVPYTADRDLWRWELPGSKEANAALRSYPMDFETWDKLAEASFSGLVAEGAAILRYQDQVVKMACEKAVMGSIGGYNVPVLNSTTLISEIAGKLAEDHTFAACFFIRGDGKVVYSLRSKGSFKVNEIAKQYGGGGHPNAAGFVVDKVL